MSNKLELELTRELIRQKREQIESYKFVMVPSVSFVSLFTLYAGILFYDPNRQVNKFSNRCFMFSIGLPTIALLSYATLVNKLNRYYLREIELKNNT